MESLNGAAWVPGTNIYRFGYESKLDVPVTGAPSDANFRRWSMLHDRGNYRLYCFRDSTRNTLYQFVWNGEAYQYGHNCDPILTLTNIPADADLSSFAVVHSGAYYHLYVRRLGDPLTLYQFLWIPGTTTYNHGHSPGIPWLEVGGFPVDTDFSRWMMLHDGKMFRLYAFKLGSNTTIYQAAWTGSEYLYGHESIPMLELEGTPRDSDLASAAMLHDGDAYRLYVQTL